MSESKNSIKVGKDAVGSVIVSGNGNKTNLSTSAQSEEIRKPPRKQKPRTLSPLTYSVISLIAFAMGVGLLFIKSKQIDSRSKISGCVRDTENKPLKDVDINLPNCLLVKTGDDGCFGIRIPPECQREKIAITASEDGYENWESPVYPETGQEIKIVLNKSK